MKNFAFGNIREFDRKAAEESRTVEFIISSSDRDRHRTIVNMGGWNLENFNLNPIVGYQHNVYGDNMCQPDNPDNVLGPGRAYLEDGKLIGAVTFETKEINPLAEKIFQKVLNGTLRATSVGFLEVGTGKYGEGEERQGGKNETYYFSGQELLEFSIVNIPSNAKAVGRSMIHHADAALAYLMKFMPESISKKDIRRMSVQQVLDIVEKTAKGDVVRMMMPGDSVKVKKGREHSPDHDGMVMTIQDISTHAISTKMEDGTIHKWYIEDELELAEEMGEMEKKKKKDRLAMRMAIMKHELKIN
jgi:hypothetical protein